MLESRSSFSRLQRRKKLVIRSLGSGDVYAYRNLRLRALEEHPEAFSTSFSEEQKQSLEETKNRLLVSPQQITHGAFKADQLVGISTLIRSHKEKLRHRAILAAMYVIPEERGKGIARDLLTAALESAFAWGVSDVTLAVTVGNDRARKLYTRIGFLSYGIEPRSLCVDGVYFNVEWLNLRLS